MWRCNTSPASGQEDMELSLTELLIIVQRAGEAVYSEAGQKQTGEQIAYYMNNAKVTILEGLKSSRIYSIRWC